VPGDDFVSCSSEAVDGPDDDDDVGVENDDATTTSTTTTATAPAPAAKVQMSAMLKWPAAANLEKPVETALLDGHPRCAPQAGRAAGGGARPL
jgi:hypothetical protein